MARVDPPYFFNEFLQQIGRTAPTERERTLGLTLNDLDWLHTLYYDTDHARRDPQMRRTPMVVEALTLYTSNKGVLPLAGAFLMSPGPDDKKAVLYTPYGGMEVFESRDAVLLEVTSRLKDSVQCIDLIKFLSISQRAVFTAATVFTLTASPIERAVFKEQQTVIETCQALNVQDMLAHLRQTPRLPEMLDALLLIMAKADFPDLDPSDAHVESRIEAFDETTGRQSTVPLRDALLQYYLNHAWPAGQTRTFIKPRQRYEGAQRWESLVEQTAEGLDTPLNNLLQAWWNEDLGGGQSRRMFFAQAMSDKFRMELLLKQQAGVVSAEESHRLLAVFLPNSAARGAWPGSVNVDKVGLYAPYQPRVTLAGTLFIGNELPFLYTQAHGLQVLETPQDLVATLLSLLKVPGQEGELLSLLSIEERELYLSMQTLQLSGLAIDGGVFEALVDDVVNKQSSNMLHALGVFRRSEGNVHPAALFDCALDVRHLFDSRLLALDAQGRWSLHPLQSGDGLPTTMQAERAKRTLTTQQATLGALTEQRRNHPTLRRLVTQGLNAALKLRALDLKADAVFVNTYTSEAGQLEERVPEHSVSMVDHAIERLSDVGGPVSGAPHIGFYGPRIAGVATRYNNLTSASFNSVVERALVPFINHNVRALARKFLHENADQLNTALLLGLRNEVQLRQADGTLNPHSAAILDAVLQEDGLTRFDRHDLQGFLPDAYGLTLKIGDDETAHTLANCFVLSERGGIDPLLSGRVVLWTRQRGYETFTSMRDLHEALTLRLNSAQERLALLENLPINRRVPHQTYQAGALQRIDEHLLNVLQQNHLDTVLANIDHWLVLGLPPTQLNDCLDMEMYKESPSNLGRAQAIAQGIVQQQTLPVWLGTAAPDEQVLYAELLEQYLQSAPQEQDYLHDVQPLRDYVAGQLRTSLRQRYPGHTLEPDDVLIRTPHVLEGQALSLTDYALRHLPELSGEHISPYSHNATSLPPGLDGAAVAQMILQLDTAEAYRTLLTTHLTSTTDDTRKRQALFCRQLPWQLLCLAYEEKLKQRLSAKAWELVTRVFDRPDAVARDKVSGATAVIRPLELIATDGATPVKVPGVYLIGPKPPVSGPVVLYAPYRAEQVLQEFAHEPELLNLLNRPGPLQVWVIRQLEDADQATYRDLWHSPAPNDAPDIALAVSPVRGNVLAELFSDNTRQLMKMLNAQFQKDGKGLWETVTGVLSEGIPPALRFFGGMLQFPLVVWRSFNLFKTSAEHLQQQRWKDGMKTFIQGVAAMASLRKELVATAATTAPASTDSTATDSDSTAPTNRNITQPSRTQLQPFESTTTALADLQENTLARVYTAALTGRNYVPVAGKVYPVIQAGERWRIAQQEAMGPYVRLNTASKWVLDLTDCHPRFGLTCSRPDNDAYLRDEINIEAEGMPAIAELSRWKAQCITEALNVATYYAVNAKRNLVAFARRRSPKSRAGRILTKTFGVANLNPTQVGKIEKRIDEVLGELVNPTLMRPDSSRFVIGTARWDPVATYGFTVTEDHDKKIYLVNRFFDPWLDLYQNRLTAPFDYIAHARATVLLHELAHLMCEAEDIAYLDSMRPFHDLINVNAPNGRAMFAALSQSRETALSVLTPASQLFKKKDEDTNAWEDLGADGATLALNHVLKLTGAATLDDARQVFMSDQNKRMDVILGNADSVAYLIALLGRVLDPGA